ncbi:hypothetical protein KGMB01110_24970 [Mediterraneibacter butyricigenes]|uniref:Uncharacterized protein n=1 Tax=Mediterraneibacter butyricigenes TaxID=2316025 RepID=A0A391P2U2_9FIRM|nr:hypothetical protein [Mediterraneibacter butyricigenes]GCA68061.1 hypothetical protein KGMB01110_24970 [Mediterraneibacter butyricigenes]
MEESKKPNKPLSVLYADAKQEITRSIDETVAAHRLPLFMVEGILSGVLAEIRTNAMNELADETARHEKELEYYHKCEMEHLVQEFEKGSEEVED